MDIKKRFSSALLTLILLFQATACQFPGGFGSGLVNPSISVEGEQNSDSHSDHNHNSTPEPHLHTYSKEWSSNASYHWHDATCGHNVKQDYTAHAFGNWEEVIEATEYQEGLKQRTCEVCGYLAQQVINKKPHTHDYYYNGQVDATCTSGGYDLYSCDCGASKKENITSFLGHDLIKEQHYDEEYHWDYSYCTRCDYSKETTHKAHTLKEEVINAPTEISEGLSRFYCSSCSYETIKATSKLDHSHNFSTEQRVEATCEADGYVRHYCDCGVYMEVETLYALGHDLYTNTEYTDEHHYDRTLCNRCDYMVSTDPVEHNFDYVLITEATCEEDGLEMMYCDGCDYEMEHPLLALGHDYNENNICNNCGAEYYTEGLIFHYDVAWDAYFVTGYQGIDSNVIIPSKYHGLPVIIIQKDAFKNCSIIESISIPETITTIGSGAFVGTSLTELTIPNSVTSIGSNIIDYETKIETLSIPFIGASKDDLRLFYYIYDNESGNSMIHPESIKHIKITGEITKIVDCAFMYVTSLESIELSSSIVEIGSNAFSFTGIKEFDFTYVETIGSQVFANTKVEKLILGENLKNINEYAFNATDGIDNFYFKGSQQLWVDLTVNVEMLFTYEIVYNYSSSHEHSYVEEVIEPTCEEQGYTVYTCDCGSKYKDNFIAALGHDLYTYKEYTDEHHYDRTLCNRCDYMESTEPVEHNLIDDVFNEPTCEEDGEARVYCDECDYEFNHPIPALGHNYNEEYVCDSCGHHFYTEGLEFTLYGTSAYFVTGYSGENVNIIVPEIYEGLPVIRIDNAAFGWISYIVDVHLPNSIEYIGTAAFEGCVSLTNINLPNSLTKIEASAFILCTSLTEIYIPDNVNSIGESAFRDCGKLQSIVVGSENLVYDSRDNCNAIIDTLNNELLYGCQNTVIPNTISKIHESAFEESLITSISIPNSVTSIGDYAFSQCKFLKEVYIGTGISNIPFGAFSDCSSLIEVHFTNSIKTIKQYAFFNCNSLSNIYFEGSNEEWNSINISPYNDMLDMVTVNLIEKHEYTLIIEGIYDDGKTTDLLYLNIYLQCEDPNCEIITSDSLDVNIDIVDSKAPTCYEDGYDIYNVYVEYEGISYSGSFTDILPLISHDYAYEIVWDDENLTYNKPVDFICDFCGYIEQVEAEEYTLERIEPTCEEDGIWTVQVCLSISAEEYYEEHTFVLETLGHDYNEEYVCNNCGEEYYTEGLQLELSAGLDSYFVDGYTGTSSEVIIPSVHKGLPVTTIIWNAFKDCEHVESIYIPNSITEIFGGAFIGTSITELIIPNSVTSIWANIFDYNTKIETLSVPFIGASADDQRMFNYFYDNAAGHAMNYPSSIKTIKVTGDYETLGNVFYYVGGIGGIELVEIAGSITIIDGSAFEFGGATVIDLSNITEIRYHAFYYAKLDTLILGDDLVKVDDAAFEYAFVSNIYYKGSQESFDNIFYNIDVTNINVVCNYNPDHEHSYVEEVIEPTCEEQGYTIYTCECGDTYQDNYVEAKGHDFTFDSTYVEGTCEENGMYYYYCECGAVEESVAPPLGHDYNEEFICNNCGDNYYTDGLKFTLNEDGETYTISGYTGETGSSVDIILPAVYEGKKVTTIGSDLFNWKSIGTVRIPEGITVIENRAFHYSDSLKNIDLPSTLTTIGEYAFYMCSSVKALEIPESVTSIGKGAFYGIPFESFVIPDGIEVIGEHTFAECHTLKTLTLPSSITTIEQNTFMYISNSITINYKGSEEQWNSISIASEGNDCLSISTINYNYGHEHSYVEEVIEPTCEEQGYTIYTCECGDTYQDNYVEATGHKIVTTPAIEPTCEYDGWTEGSYCDLCNTVFYVPTTLPALGHDYNEEYVCNNCEYHYYTEGLEFTLSDDGNSYKVTGYTGTSEDVIIPAVYNSLPVLIIDTAAFASNNTIKNVFIGNGITRIGDYAFIWCESIETISIPDSVTEIWKEAFCGCSSLTSIVIPTSVTYLGWYTFNVCSSLTTIYFKGTEQQWNVIATEEVKQDLTNVTIVYNYVGAVCLHQWSLTEMVLTPTCEEGGEYIETCSLCNETRNVLIEPIDHEYTEEHTCNLCGQLDPTYYTVGLQLSLNSEGTEYEVIGYTGSDNKVVVPMFYNELPVVAISYSAFLDNATITEVVLPSTIKEIRQGAFYGCSSLTTINLPEGLTTIGEMSFRNCESLQGELIIPGTVTFIDDQAFQCCISLTAIKFESGSESLVLDTCAFYYCSNVTEVTFTTSLTSIGSSAFGACSNLTTVKYYGLEEQWNEIEILDDNFTNCNFIFEFNEGIFTLLNINGIDNVVINETSTGFVVEFTVVEEWNGFSLYYNEVELTYENVNLGSNFSSEYNEECISWGPANMCWCITNNTGEPQTYKVFYDVNENTLSA